MPSLQQNVERVAEYYAAQASVFDEISGFGTEPIEAIYAPLKSRYLTAFKGSKVLELACGTGYWTQVLASTARSVLATDVNAQCVEITRQKVKSLPNVQCQVADAYSLEGVSDTFDAAFSHFWLSHVPRKNLKSFLSTLHSRLEPGALVLFTDNLEYHGDSIKQRIDEHGDIYEERILKDGRRFETIKNFLTKPQLFEFLDGIADRIEYSEHLHMWTLFYRVRH